MPVDILRYRQGLRLVLGELRVAEKEKRVLQVKSVPTREIGYEQWVAGVPITVDVNGRTVEDITSIYLGHPCGAVILDGPSKRNWGKGPGNFFTGEFEEWAEKVESFKIKK